MDEGFVKLYRKLLHSPIMLDAEALQVFIYFLLRARHQRGPARMNGKTIMLEPGQLITGRFVLAESLGLTPSKVRRILSVLKNNDQISQQVNAKFSIISVTNWSEYQGSNQLTASSQPADSQQATTNKTEEKGENGKNEEHGGDEQEGFGFIPTTPTLMMKDGVYTPPAKTYQAWVDAYPHTDITTEFKLMAAWQVSNPGKAKTKRGASKFINGWLGRNAPKSSSSPPKTELAAEIKEAAEEIF